MKLSLVADAPSTPRLRVEVRALAASLERRLGPEGRPAALRVSTRAAADGQWEAKLALDLGADTVIAHDRHDLALEAVRAAFRSLRRELMQRRVAADVVARARRASRSGPAPVRGPTDGLPLSDSVVEALLAEVVPTAMRIARHHLARLEAAGRVTPGAIIATEVVGDAVVDLLEGVVSGSGPVAPLTEWLILRIEALAAALPATEPESLEAAIPSPDAAVYALPDDALFDLTLRDDAPRLGATLADPDASSPEDIVAAMEVRHLLVEALFDLPRDVRAAFAWALAGDRSLVDAAREEAADPVALAAKADAACDHLATRLAGATALGRDDVIALYRRLGGRLVQLVASHP